jgi:hypothetical protein
LHKILKSFRLANDVEFQNHLAQGVFHKRLFCLLIGVKSRFRQRKSLGLNELMTTNELNLDNQAGPGSQEALADELREAYKVFTASHFMELRDFQ